MKLTPRIATMSGTSGARRPRSPLALAGVLCASVALLVAAPAASAATAVDSYGHVASFGGNSYPAYPSFSEFNAVAVDGSTGNIFVAQVYTADTTKNNVAIFSSDTAAGGVPLTTAEAPAVHPSGVAIDQANGSLYVVDSASNTVLRFLSDGALVPTYTLDPSFNLPGPLSFPTGLAVDPVTHDVLVGDGSTNRVDRFDSTGALISSFDGSNTVAGAFSSVGSLAVGPTGTVYVVDPSGGRVARFDSAGASLGELPIAVGGSPSRIAVNPQSGNVAALVSREGKVFIEGFDAAGQLTFFPPDVTQQVSETPVGLAWDSSTDRIYLDINNGTVHTFAPGIRPGVDTPIVSQVTGTSAHLESKVAPGGVETSARFEYCPVTAKCAEYPESDPNPESSNPWVRLPDHSGLSGSGEITIEDDLTGLEPDASYLVRVSAENGLIKNTSATTPLNTPLIPPLTQTGSAGAITDVQAELTGTITAYGHQTTYHFEYGPTTSYGSSAPAGAEGVAGNSRKPRAFSRTITGLQPGTTYHYRLVATNSAGTANGADRTFTTLAADEVAPSRGFEQVSPVDKRGATIAPFGFHAAPDGSAISYLTVAPSTDVEGAPLNPRYVSRRGSSDWSDWQSTNLPQNVARGVMESGTQALSSDFTHALAVTNRALSPGAFEGGGNLYVIDLQTGTRSFVGGANGVGAYLAMSGLGSQNMYLEGAPDFSWIVFASAPPLLPGVNGFAIYKWTEAGGLEVESRLPGPNGGSVPSGSVVMQDGGSLSRRQVSEDGKTMYFALNGADAGVYRRENGQTTPISVSQIPGDPSTPAGGLVDGISPDGRYAIFRSGRLTSDAAVPVGDQPADIYQYDSVTGNLTYVGPANGYSQNFVFGVGDDAQTVYYNDFAKGTVVWHHGTSHVVTSQPVDQTNFGLQGFPSPNGRFFAYLDGDGNDYLYDADTEESSCMSCPPDGSADGEPRLIIGARYVSNRVPTVVTDSGTAYFDTKAKLTSADHNGTRDVYSFQNGKLTLISAGDGPYTSTFADASADGSSVFFVTNEPLVSRDTDQAADVYVSRVGGGFSAQSPPAPPASCVRSECGEADSGPLSSAPFSSSQAGPPAKPKKHCPKGTHARKVKGKTRCVKPSNHKKKAKRANTNRRQGR